MAKDKSTLRFWLRTDKPNNDTSAAITLIYQVKGQRKYFWIPNVKLFENNWDAKEQKAIYIDKKVAKKLMPEMSFDKLPTKQEVDEINDKLDQKRKEIRDIEKLYELKKITYTAKMVIDQLKETLTPVTKKEDPTIRIVDFIRQYVKESEGSHKFRTLQAYLGLATHLDDYEKKSGNAATFNEINIPFLRGFIAYLLKPRQITLPPLKAGKERNPRKVQGMNNITIAKQISTLKTLLRAARTIYKIEVNPDYQDYKVSRKDSSLEVVTLTNDEFLTLYNYDFSENKTWERVRDVFCFACATGLRYSDLAQLKQEHIQYNTIRMTAAKTGQRLDIPLNPFSLAILEKYKSQHEPLPIISGQKTNKYLKELAKKAGIDAPVEKVREYGVKREADTYEKWELMSIHMGRRTFTTLSLEKGMAPQEVMALTGHTTFKAFKRYVDVTNERKKAVMAQAWGEVKESNLKVV